MSLPIIPLGLMGGGTRAFPTLRAAATYREISAQNSHSVTLPSGTTTGDLVVVFGRFAALVANLTVEFPAPAGWTRFANEDWGTTAAELNAYWRIADGPMSSVTLARESGAMAAASAFCNAYSFSEHSGVAPVISSIPQQLSTASPDPPSLSVPGTWGPSPHVTWLSCLYKFGTSTTTSPSSGYSDLIGTLDGAVRMASARRNLQATVEDPGPWTISAANGGNPFAIAVRGPE